MKLAAYFLMSGSLLLAAMPARANSDMQKEIDDLREDLMVLQRQIYRGANMMKLFVKLMAAWIHWNIRLNNWIAN